MQFDQLKKFEYFTTSLFNVDQLKVAYDLLLMFGDTLSAY